MPGRLGGSVAAPRCCAPLALTQPPPAKGLHASTRCPAEATTLIGIRVFFGGYHTYRFAYLSFAYPPHIINSRIYDVGINCHKYVKYVDSRTALLCPSPALPWRLDLRCHFIVLWKWLAHSGVFHPGRVLSATRLGSPYSKPQCHLRPGQAGC